MNTDSKESQNFFTNLQIYPIDENKASELECDLKRVCLRSSNKGGDIVIFHPKSLELKGILGKSVITFCEKAQGDYQVTLLGPYLAEKHDKTFSIETSELKFSDDPNPLFLSKPPPLCLTFF